MVLQVVVRTIIHMLIFTTLRDVYLRRETSLNPLYFSTTYQNCKRCNAMMDFLNVYENCERKIKMVNKDLFYALADAKLSFVMHETISLYCHDVFEKH